MVMAAAVFNLPALADPPASLNKEIVYRASLGRIADIDLLLKQGADPNAKNENGVPILALAAARKDEDSLKAVQTLIEAGADINAKDAGGQTALFYAAKDGKKEIVQYLLERGIQYYTPDQNGDIARTIAYKAGHQEIMELMDAFVANQTKKTAEEYKKYHELLEERNREILARQKQQLLESDPLLTAPPEQPPATTQALPSLAAPPPDPAAEEAARQAEWAKKRETPEFKQAMRTLALDSCLFQYLSFCAHTGQRSDLSAEAMTAGIAERRESIVGLLKQLPETYGLSAERTTGLSERAKQSIQDEMDAMPSKVYIFEHGVCRQADIDKRCKAKADSWWNFDGAAEPHDEKEKTAPKSSSKKPPQKNIGPDGIEQKSLLFKVD